MSTYVFLGPTLSAERARGIVDATILPPVSQGDVIALLRRNPTRIAIVDGYFERVPAVWHKEILLALSRGVRVYGASSLGALRAVELEPYGMVGVGEIVRWYREGRIDGDDEVAIQHGPAEFGYPALSVALVNVRATLEAAAAEGILDAASAALVVEAAKEMFYADRHYKAILARARAMGVASESIDGLTIFLERGRVDLKERDAIALLSHLSQLAAQPVDAPESEAARFELQRTAYLERLVDRDRPVRTPSATHRPDDVRVTIEDLVDHARLSSPCWEEIRERASAHAFAVDLARRLELRPTPEGRREAAERLWRSLGRADAEARRAWMEENDVTPEEMELLVSERAMIDALRRAIPPTNAQLVDQLRLAGAYAGLVEGAAVKESACRAAMGTAMPSREEIVSSYFEGPAPDLSAFARTRGFEDRNALLRELERHYHYRAAHREPHRPAR